MDKIKRIYQTARVNDVSYSTAAESLGLAFDDATDGRRVRHYADGVIRTPDAVPYWSAGPRRSYRLAASDRVVWAEVFEDEVRFCAGLDLHFGAASFMPAVVDRFLKWLSKRFWIVPGDAFDNALASRFGGGGEPLDSHFEAAKRLLAPHSRRLLGVWSGNHDDWSKKTGALHPGKMLAESLGVPFISGPGQIVMIVNGRPWIIAVEHGRGAGKSDGYKGGQYPVEPLRMKGRTADVSVRAHLHDARHSHITYFAPCWETGKLQPRIAIGLVAGASLDYGGYPADKCLDPISPATSYVKLTSYRELRREDAQDYDLRGEE